MIINITPHFITFLRSSDGVVYELPPCGVVLEAKFVEESVGTHTSGVKLVRTRIEPTLESVEALAKLEHKHPEAVIVGSIIDAQAFPGRVAMCVPVPGFERRPPSEKRMQEDKFSVF